VAAFVGIGYEARQFKKCNAMMDLVVAGECGRKQRLALWSGWRICASIYRHAKHLAVPVEHGIEVGGG